MTIDTGAVRAIEEQGRSLLAIGIAGVDGEFDRGSVVALVDPAGQELARGLTNYDAQTVRRIAGKRSTEISELLGGGVPYAEVIHRDNLVLTR